MKKILLLTICGLLALAGCKNLFDAPEEENTGEGPGYFSLSIDGVSVGRTVMPPLSLATFGSFELIFNNTDAPYDYVTETRTNANNISIPLNAGTYDLTVNAYKNAGDTAPMAQGTLTGIEIGTGKTTFGTITLAAHMGGGGSGTLSYNLTYNTVAAATMTITPYDPDTGSAKTALSLATANATGSRTLNAGYYLVSFNLRNSSGASALYKEVVHIYSGETSTITATIDDAQFLAAVLVTTGTGTGAGSLSAAITNVPDGGTIIIDRTVGTIESCGIGYSGNKSFTIEGNGVIITAAPGALQYLLSFDYPSSNLTSPRGEITIRRVWFKDAITRDYPVYNRGGTLNLESCIFSGNRGNNGGAVNTSNISVSSGGNTYSFPGILRVKGSSFYNNTAAAQGGAIYQASGSLFLEGNVFYGNTAASYTVVRIAGGDVTPSYNVVDKPLGTTANDSGFIAAGTTGNGTGNTAITGVPMSFRTFRLLANSAALGKIPSTPAGYPEFDFYGYAVPGSNAAAGAVQATATGSGIVVDTSVNNRLAGSVDVSPTPPNADGLVDGATATVTAIPNSGYTFSHWLVNGQRETGASYTINAHSSVRAVFTRTVNITESADTNTEGTLRYALNNAQTGDIININLGNSTITLGTAALPTIREEITINGNGVTLTSPSFTNYPLNINTAATVTISRVWFKNFSGSVYPIYINGATVNLESCIFSGNRNSAGASIYYSNFGTVNIRGCTFYGNIASSNGLGYSNGGTIYLTGNVFYGNVPSTMLFANVTRNSNGFNVVDLTSALASFTTNANDVFSATALPVSPVTLRLVSGSPAAGRITARPTGYPIVDFYGYTIPANSAAAGAVQQQINTGYYLDLSVNNTAAGSATLTSGTANTEGLYPNGGSVTVNATPTDSNSTFKYWLVGTIGSTLTPQYGNTLTITLNAHTTAQAVFSRVVSVNSETTFRTAVNNAQDGDIIEVTVAANTTFTLSGAMSTNKNITINGNGVTLTKTTSTSALTVNSPAEVTISRVWFKGIGSSTPITVSAGATLNLESCIFSDGGGTATDPTITQGGALYNNGGTINVKGCTFANNRVSATTGGAVVYQSATAAVLNLQGNLFIGNKVTAATNTYPIVNLTGTRNSLGYNVFDVTAGTGNGLSGFAMITSDRENFDISDTPWLDLTAFRPTQTELDNPEWQIIDTDPGNYPAFDFYGDPITFPARPGAAQNAVTGNTLTINAYPAGAATFTTSPATPGDGFWPDGASVTITRNPASGYTFAYWDVDGGAKNTNTTITVTMDASKTVTVYFNSTWTVNQTGDDASTAGTLRYALDKSIDGDKIVTTAGTVITLESPLSINKNLTFNGNGATTGVTITASSSLNTGLLTIAAGTTVTIDRLWFKDINTGNGSVIKNEGTLTLTSSIFSGNTSTGSSGNGSAIHNIGTLSVLGCTFYNNTAGTNGATIYQATGASTTATLTGNVFFQNTADNAPSIANHSGFAPITSGGYNVVDMEYYDDDADPVQDSQCGWEANANDKMFSELFNLDDEDDEDTYIDPDTFTPFEATGSDYTYFQLKDDYKDELTIIDTSLSGGFPAVDFGNAPRGKISSNNADVNGAPGAVEYPKEP